MDLEPPGSFELDPPSIGSLTSKRQNQIASYLAQGDIDMGCGMRYDCMV